MISDELRKEFRHRIGAAVFDGQNYLKDEGVSVEDALIQVLDALISLTALIAHNNAGITKAGFIALSTAAANDEYKNS